jgi:hypothetical protein
MSEPEREFNPVERGAVALLPFVHAWNLSLNPEDLHELAYAVLRHAYSAETYAEIADAVKHQIAEVAATHQRMSAAMGRGLRGWAAQVCHLPTAFREGGSSIRELFEPAAAHLDDRGGFVQAVSAWLREEPALIDVWLTYSADKRAHGPFLSQDSPAVEVGFYDPESGRRDITRHSGPIEACADYIYREAAWVLRKERVS